jgi:hypothetical protein
MDILTTGSGVGQKDSIRQADEALLASLGYKQEFKRAFTPLEVHELLNVL